MLLASGIFSLCCAWYGLHHARWMFSQRGAAAHRAMPRRWMTAFVLTVVIAVANLAMGSWVLLDWVAGLDDSRSSGEAPPVTSKP